MTGANFDGTPMVNHRIAITGASSMGKTTLAVALMRNSGFRKAVKKYIPEGARSLLRRRGHTSFDAMTRDELRSFTRDFFVRKQQREARFDTYLVDRSFVDVAAIWVERDSFDLSDEIQNEILIPCRRLAQTYTLIVHLHARPFAFAHDGVRETDLVLHERIAARIGRYLRDWSLPCLTLQSSTVELRVEEVKTALGIT
jgi:predicted ATPase